MSIVVPFDHNPQSIVLKTSSYTIPAGKYARVNIISPNFQINGTQQFPSGTLTASTGSGTTASDTATAAVSLGGPAYVYSASVTRAQGASMPTASSSGGFGNGTESTGYAWINQATRTNSAGTTSISAGLNPAHILWVYASYTGGTGGSHSSSCTVSYYTLGANPDEIWVPSGTVLAGDFYRVTEYNVIS